MILHILTCLILAVPMSASAEAQPVAFDSSSLSERAFDQERSWEPYLTRDMKSVVFLSGAAPGDIKRGRAFKSTRTADGWSKPEPLYALDDPSDLWFPNGDPYWHIYSSGDLHGGAGRSDLSVIDARHRVSGPQRLKALSAKDTERHPSVSSDGQWMVFVSDRQGGLGRTDLWLSQRQGDGTWGTPVNAGPEVNTAAYEVAAIISADGEALYFIRAPDQVLAVKLTDAAPKP